MSDSKAKNKEIIKAFNRKWWRRTIMLAIALLGIELVAKFYYIERSDNQIQINGFLKQEIIQLDRGLKELKSLQTERYQYIEMLAISEDFNDNKERDFKFLSLLLVSIPFEWSIKQIKISRAQPTLVIETLKEANLNLGIERLNKQFEHYQVALSKKPTISYHEYDETQINFTYIERTVDE